MTTDGQDCEKHGASIAAHDDLVTPEGFGSQAITWIGYPICQAPA